MYSEKQNFINRLPIQPSCIHAIKKVCALKYDNSSSAYNIISSYNANIYNTPIKEENLLSFLKTSYDYMYKFIANIDRSKIPNDPQLAFIKDLYLSGKLKQNPTPIECKDFFFNTLSQNSEYPLIHAQSGNYPIAENGFIAPDFIHAYPFGYVNPDCRLYLNTTPDCSCKIAEELVKECYNNHMRLYLKFDTIGQRNDSMLIYCNYKTIDKFIEMLNKIKKEKPELFIGATKSGPFTASVNNFISFGEEPEYKHSSFNAERAAAIESFYNNEITRYRKAIGTYNGVFTNRYGQKQNLKEYICYKLESAFINQLHETQENIKKGIFPSHITNKNVNSYINTETNIYNLCIPNIHPVVKQKIINLADRIVSDLQKGYSTSSRFSIPFATKDASLSAFSEEHTQTLLKTTGHIPYSIKFSFDIEKQLFSIFNVREKFLNSITIENVRPYLEKHHVSADHIHLNTETVKEINSTWNY